MEEVDGSAAARLGRARDSRDRAHAKVRRERERRAADAARAAVHEQRLLGRPLEQVAKGGLEEVGPDRPKVLGHAGALGERELVGQLEHLPEERGTGWRGRTLVRVQGLASTCCCGATQYSEYPPPYSSDATRSPGLKSDMPAPQRTTTPEISRPMIR